MRDSGVGGGGGGGGGVTCMSSYDKMFGPRDAITQSSFAQLGATREERPLKFP